MAHEIRKSSHEVVMKTSVKVGKWENPKGNPRSKDENEKQTQPANMTLTTRSGKGTQATLVIGERSHQWTNASACDCSNRKLQVVCFCCVQY